jgi:Flp pilus assembly CpaF family ATPase
MMAESAADLQKQLDSFSDYCDIWRLKVNVEKKIVIFSQLRTLNNIKFNFNGKQLEIVDSVNHMCGRRIF